MSTIRSHNVILSGGDDTRRVVLRPLTDEHLPYLYKWNSDPDVLYWVEGDEVDSYPPEVIDQIYGSISQANYCFIVEVNGEIVGECWLQHMNLPDVSDTYEPKTDVRRIDMCIGEKLYWGKGIGTILVGMLVDFAFTRERVDVLHCFSEDYNVRSCRVWEKIGFQRIKAEEIEQPSKGKLNYHWRLTRTEYERREQD